MDYIKKQLELKLKDIIEYVRKENINVWVAGGAITSLATNRDINDYDLYFKDKESACKMVEYLIEDAHVPFISKKSVTFIDKNRAQEDMRTFQTIYYDYYETAEDIFKHFDYTINMAAYNLNTAKFSCHECFMLHNSQRMLQFNTGTRFPIISALRVQKYKERGYDISRKEFMKLLLSINKLNITSWDEFKEQCGELYGNNYLEEIDTTSEFCLDTGIEAISNVEMTQNYNSSWKIPMKLLPVVIMGEPVKYTTLEDGSGYSPDLLEALEDCNWEECVEILNSCNITMEETSVKGLLGEYLYKWVDYKHGEYSSVHRNHYKYNLGKEATPNQSYHPYLYAHPRQGIEGHWMGGGFSRVCLKLTYNEEDIKEINHAEVKLSKFTPVEVITFNKESN